MTDTRRLQSQRNLTLDGGQNEESRDAVVEATGGLGNTGQDGEGIQQVAAEDKPVSGTHTQSFSSLNYKRATGSQRRPGWTS